MKYKINIEEVVNGDFEVEASSKEEAFKIACNKYYSGEFINEPGQITYKQMSVVKNNQECNDWKEF